MEVIKLWLELILDTFKEESEDGCIAVHCVAGLGRCVYVCVCVCV